MSNEIKSVFGIVLSSNSAHFVMVKRRDNHIWVLPGGGIDPGETPEAACLREVKEETGLTCEIVRKIGTYDHKYAFPVRAIVFECRPLSGNLQVTDETSDIAYFSLTAPPHPFLPVFNEFLSDALQNQPPLYKKRLHSVTYRSVAKFFLGHPLIALRYLLSKIGLRLNHG